MENMPEIAVAGPADLAKLGYILGDAFSNDPCMNWVIPHVGLYAGFYSLLAKRLYMPSGLVFMDGEARAAAMWLPPGVAHRVPLGLDQLMLVEPKPCGDFHEGGFGRFAGSKKFLASSFSFRRNSNSVPWSSLVPDFVVTLTTPPMARPYSAE